MDEECPKCHGTGVIKEKNGQVHTCWECLAQGKLEVHSKQIPDSKIKI